MSSLFYWVCNFQTVFLTRELLSTNPMWQHPPYSAWQMPLTQPQVILSSPSQYQQICAPKLNPINNSNPILLPHMKILDVKTDSEGISYKPVIDPEYGILYQCAGCNSNKLFKKISNQSKKLALIKINKIKPINL